MEVPPELIRGRCPLPFDQGVKLVTLVIDAAKVVAWPSSSAGWPGTCSTG
jgi:hypothetical protein